jgi:hypothetical protein
MTVGRSADSGIGRNFQIKSAVLLVRPRSSIARSRRSWEYARVFLHQELASNEKESYDMINSPRTEVILSAGSDVSSI